ncbi:hypothetical protein AWJ20_1823 [Sugiyamaella lignohabitans]|uniref:FATC domain-containing protein n=1 Tax=Sugiyamaella lignohabitans TaxID=796027 RepID=A0A161HKI7_9ASCO|nr:uncharacterized protein AWJ20_1823 [Sugiyamaella lignohabitans]ANB13527.1 hypothetical protein AWJ20_1823 [Sugiyamaella lignohabitans]
MSDRRKQELQGIWQDGDILDEAEISTEAGSAIVGVQAKLSTKLSVEATVREQIQEAMDPNNLAVIFRGK